MTRLSTYLKIIIAIIFTFNLITAIFAQENEECDNIIETDILIIGAGITGLVAYNELKTLDTNLNVLIVEATNRYGGRVKKGIIGKNNATIEIGANWLHHKDTPL